MSEIQKENVNQIQKSDQNQYAIMENVIARGDLSKLSNQERVKYYRDVCASLKLNPLTRPFQFITFDGKLALYAAKDCSEQLRTIRSISIEKLEKEVIDGVYIVTAYARDPNGRTDIATGATAIKGLAGKALANAYKIAETQSKRRVTLSICGLGWTDESEIPDIQGAKSVEVDFETGEIIQKVIDVKEPELLPAINEQDVRVLINNIHTCNTLDELKTAYMAAMQATKGHKDIQDNIITAKDMIKSNIEAADAKLKKEYQEESDGA